MLSWLVAAVAPAAAPPAAHAGQLQAQGWSRGCHPLAALPGALGCEQSAGAWPPAAQEGQRVEAWMGSGRRRSTAAR